MKLNLCALVCLSACLTVLVPGFTLAADRPNILVILADDLGYADVGLRLAFTAPARSLAERAKWIFGEPHYIWAQSSPAQADAKN